mmetsp:Transcript_7595/g.11601  ORF Transcript_7595/g.11601 Transcript_7595/m.11601 type:complete len:330 (+) Transcript_7595:103-1092(+)
MVLLQSKVAMLLLLSSAKADTLLRNGLFKTTNSDVSDLKFGGGLYKNTAGNGCSSNTYYDRCDDVDGERVWASDVGKDSYILSTNSITYCGRYRTTSSCILSNALGTTTSTSTSYGGVTRMETLVGSDGVSSINLGRKIPGACTSGCTDPITGKIKTALPDETCKIIAGNWRAMNDNYKEMCAVKQTCNKVEVLQACEGTETKSLAGIYVPAPSSECTSSDVDQTRSKYMKEGREEVYLYFNGSRWTFRRAFCAGIGVSTGSFDAGSEPFNNPGSSVRCYDGGYGSNKDYRSTTLELRCVEKSSSSSAAVSSVLLFSFLAALVILVTHA